MDGDVVATDVLTTNGKIHNDLRGKDKRVFYFSSVGDTDTWASGISGITAVYWQGDDVDTDIATAYVSAGSTGTITFQTNGAGFSGEILVLCDT